MFLLPNGTIIFSSRPESTRNKDKRSIGAQQLTRKKIETDKKTIREKYGQAKRMRIRQKITQNDKVTEKMKECICTIA